MQVKNDTVTNLIGILTHLSYQVDKIDKIIYNGRFYKHKIKTWVNTYNTKYAKGVEKTVDGISFEHEEFLDMLEATNIYLTYNIVHKQIPVVVDINKIFSEISSGNKVTRSILTKTYNEALVNTKDFCIEEENYLSMMYVTLLITQHMIEACLMEDIFYKTKEFKNFINRGIWLFGTHIPEEHKNYYNSCCKVLATNELNTYMALSELTIAYNYNKRALFGTLKERV